MVQNALVADDYRVALYPVRDVLELLGQPPEPAKHAGAGAEGGGDVEHGLPADLQAGQLAEALRDGRLDQPGAGADAPQPAVPVGAGPHLLGQVDRLGGDRVRARQEVEGVLLEVDVPEVRVHDPVAAGGALLEPSEAVDPPGVVQLEVGEVLRADVAGDVARGGGLRVPQLARRLADVFRGHRRPPQEVRLVRGVLPHAHDDLLGEARAAQGVHEGEAVPGDVRGARVRGQGHHRGLPSRPLGGPPGRGLVRGRRLLQPSRPQRAAGQGY
mmetsp:Transcript_84673/g.239892  ORF Transcript_84673/g.239892 Transcript_84673/m.239892 type:complete len:271 (-) Transcript_84673:88-900(-)